MTSVQERKGRRGGGGGEGRGPAYYAVSIYKCIVGVPTACAIVLIEMSDWLYSQQQQREEFQNQ